MWWYEIRKLQITFTIKKRLFNSCSWRFECLLHFSIRPRLLYAPKESTCQSHENPSKFPVGIIPGKTARLYTCSPFEMSKHLFFIPFRNDLRADATKYHSMQISVRVFDVALSLKLYRMTFLYDYRI